ncbi:hypothetical protein FVF58_12160 [Paraburkholderia panacisoli]|uniref:Uncharacterized protein n=1 Tax=Paraburkholderia panacisoli TaxID=2603818 RepID=A0A5B0HBG9_9BURK|nr:hypothetical protein [Paraburkholderia panacisoli]KAA1012625.1 hypothetical protein FVF58_12160 [Paraburkholderia panacisoli]
MPLRSNAVSADSRVCQWINQREALHHFGTYTGATQSQQHIKPLHWYVACRLVLEGGFHPDDVTPRPPFTVVTRGSKHHLHFDPSKATGGERTVLGGLKTKNVDVVVTKDGIGPVIAVSCKGMTGAFRNLTNRMEETIGECTNLHITYPAMVFGYMFVIRANRVVAALAEELAPDEATPARQLLANDIAVQEGGAPVESIFRFHSALRELTGRRGIRNDVSRYEAVTLAMIEVSGERAGDVLTDFPPHDSPLRLEQFFQTLYLRYEERYLFGAPDLKSITRRLEWAPESPVFGNAEIGQEAFPTLDYEVRIATSA